MGVSFNPAAAGPRPAGRPIRMQAGNALLLSAGPEHAPLLRRWMADPLVAGPMGRAPETIPDERLIDYVSRFDRLLDHLLIIHDAETGRPVGFATIAISGPHRTAMIDISIGERSRRRDTQIATSDAGRAVLHWVFETVGLRKAIVQVARDNERTAAWMAERMTLEAELRDEILMPDGTPRTLLRFGLLRSEWDGYKAWLEARDRAGVSPVMRRPRDQNPREPFAGARPPSRIADA